MISTVVENRNGYRYTPCFCEENIWHLANDLVVAGERIDDLNILFFSNPARQVIIYQQKMAPPGDAIIWDYHVVLENCGGEEKRVYDFDSRLDFPHAKADYFEQSFPVPEMLQPAQQMLIRRVSADAYLRHFESDRSHMLGVISRDRFPAYPCIKSSRKAQPILLSEYLDMTRTLADGSRVSAYQWPRDSQ